MRVSSVQAIVISVQLRNRTESQPAEFTQLISDQPLRGARITTETWHEFLDDFVHDADLVARIKTQSPR